MKRIRAYVRKNNGKPVRVKAHKRRTRKKKVPVITRSQRKIFNLISNPKNFNREHGGFIDFNKEGKMEAVDIIQGEAMEVERPYVDFEVYWHTHPFKWQSPPSTDDLTNLVKNKYQQTELIFRNGNAFIVTKTDKTKRLARKSYKELMTYFTKLLNKAEDISTPSTFEDETIKLLRDEGFIVQSNKSKGSKISFKGVQIRE